MNETYGREDAFADTPLAPSWVVRSGAIAALLLAAGYLATMPLFAMVGAPPMGVEARLDYHTTGTTIWWAITGLMVVTDLCFVPVAVAFYTVLRRADQPAILLATMFTLLFVALDLAVLWPAKVSMITLGEAYGTASPEVRLQLLAGATYPAGVIDSLLASVYSVLTLGIGILVTGIVMLRAGFGRVAAIVGIVTGALGIASVGETMLTGSFPVLVVGASLLTIVWLVLVARGLLLATAGRETQASVSAATA
jgi:hypothetical protein